MAPVLQMLTCASFHWSQRDSLCKLSHA